MEHPLQAPFNPDTLQNLAGVRRIERVVYNKIWIVVTSMGLKKSQTQRHAFVQFQGKVNALIVTVKTNFGAIVKNFIPDVRNK
jgi:hypothetical protein